MVNFNGQYWINSIGHWHRPTITTMTMRPLERDDVINIYLAGTGCWSTRIRLVPKTTNNPTTVEADLGLAVSYQYLGSRVLAVAVFINPTAPVISVVERWVTATRCFLCRWLDLLMGGEARFPVAVILTCFSVVVTTIAV